MKRMKKLMQKKRISQIALAKKLNVTDASVSKWLRWGVNIPKKHRNKICKFLGCKPSDLESAGSKCNF